uniref:Cadherin domain-containing protein n=1 Tax=Syphacia muris TaxID=451379 RepID=A0A0N5A9G9_9BILA
MVSNRCGALFLELSLDILHKGTTTEDVCYHLVHEVEIFAPKTTLHCTKFEDAVVQVDFISSDINNNVTVLKDIFKLRLHSSSAESAVIRSIQRIAERDSANVLVWDSIVLKPSNEMFSETGRLATTNQLLVVVILVLILALLMLLTGCVFKCSEWMYVKSRFVRRSALRQQQQLSPHIYYTQPLSQKLYKVPTGDKKPFFVESVCYPVGQWYSLQSFDGGLSDEVRDNEVNVRILEKLKDIAEESNDVEKFKESRKQMNCVNSVCCVSSRIRYGEHLQLPDAADVVGGAAVTL